MGNNDSLSQNIQTMITDRLLPQPSKASTTMVSTKFSGNITLSAPERYIFVCFQNRQLRERNVSYALHPTVTHWGRETQICVSNLTLIGSDNGLSHSRRRAIIWTNVGLLLIGWYFSFRIFSIMTDGGKITAIGFIKLCLFGVCWWYSVVKSWYKMPLCLIQ